MAAAGRRRGRRDNGLDARDWRAIDDLDPRVAEDVLDMLGARGIAAYVQPAMDVDPVTRSATVPDRPSDRLYVDRQYADAARLAVRTMLTELGGGRADGGDGGSGDPSTGADDRPDSHHPDHRQRDLDAAFAGIVADFDRQVDPAHASWPPAEDTGDRATTAAATPEWGATERDDPADPWSDPPAALAGTGGRQPIDARDVTEPSILHGLDTFGRDLAEPSDEPPEKFVPPTPPPLPRWSRQTVLGCLAIVVGLLLLIGRPDLLPLERSTSMLLGFATILGGAVALIMRLRPGTDPDEDPHPGDGARV